MLKTGFQKLIFAIPLRPFTAIVFCYVIGLLGLFVPWGYLHVTYTVAQKTSEVAIPIYETAVGALAINICIKWDIKWLIAPNWFFSQDMQNAFKAFTFSLVALYFMKYLPRTPRKKLWMFLVLVFSIFIPALLVVWLYPNSVECLNQGSVVVHGISANWPAFIVVPIGLLFGIYALERHKAMMSQELLPKTN